MHLYYVANKLQLWIHCAKVRASCIIAMQICFLIYCCLRIFYWLRPHALTLWKNGITKDANVRSTILARMFGRCTQRWLGGKLTAFVYMEVGFCKSFITSARNRTATWTGSVPRLVALIICNPFETSAWVICLVQLQCLVSEPSGCARLAAIGSSWTLASQS